MAPSVTVKLASRSDKKPVKGLPVSLDLPENSTVEDVKVVVARMAGMNDHNRIGLFDPRTGKTLKDRKGRVADIEPVQASEQLLVKDLGPQIDWRTVFVIEYLGPILIHVVALAARPFIFADGGKDMSRAQWLSCAMIIAHFFKREVETIFVHRFSANTMPVRNIFKNCFHYWFFSGLVCAVAIYHPRSLAARATTRYPDAIGTALYIFGELNNASVHLYLSSLRSPGGTERKIPLGHGFGLVTCPNYMYEVLAWVGIIIASRDWSVVLFLIIGATQMYAWALGKERAYRKEFGDKYKKKRYVMVPGLL